MVRQYPYELYQQVVTEATQNGSGDYVAGTDDWELVGSCRDEANTAGRTINLEDQIAYQFDAIVYLPKSVDAPTEGTSVEVRDGGTVRFSGRIRRVNKGQLNTRLWV
jgi:hypothetical protein